MLTYKDLTMDQWITLLKKLQLLGLGRLKKNVQFISDNIELNTAEIYKALKIELNHYPQLNKAADLAFEDGGYNWYNLSDEEKLHYLTKTDIQHWELYDKLIYEYKWFKFEKFITPTLIEKLIQYLNTDLDRQEYVNRKINELFSEE